jgi:membrane protease YdiL (CAAX protease family)
MDRREASGFQAAFLVFAVTLLAVPLSRWLLSGLPATRDELDLVGRAMPFFLGASIILVFPALRREAIQELAMPIPAARRWEVALVACAEVMMTFAIVGTTAWWIGASEGLLGIERQMAQDAQLAEREAFSSSGLLLLAFAGVVAPLMEELVFRGFLYRAFEREWGAFASTVLTSAFFAWYHPQFANAFLSSLLLIAVLRRTGSLWAPIAVHATGNVLLWYPLAGQYLLPARGFVTDPATWSFHILCVIVVAMGLPTYLWMARGSRREPCTADAHVALPQ